MPSPRANRDAVFRPRAKKAPLLGRFKLKVPDPMVLSLRGPRPRRHHHAPRSRGRIRARSRRWTDACHPRLISPRRRQSCRLLRHLRRRPPGAARGGAVPLHRLHRGRPVPRTVEHQGPREPRRHHRQVGRPETAQPDRLDHHVRIRVLRRRRRVREQHRPRPHRAAGRPGRSAAATWSARAWPSAESGSDSRSRPSIPTPSACPSRSPTSPCSPALPVRTALVLLALCGVALYTTRLLNRASEQADDDDDDAGLSKPLSEYSLGWNDAKVLAIFGGGLVYMLYGVFTADWYINEIAAVFLAIAIFVGIATRTSGTEFVKQMMDGASSVTPGAPRHRPCRLDPDRPRGRPDHRHLDHHAGRNPQRPAHHDRCCHDDRRPGRAELLHPPRAAARRWSRCRS